MTAGGAVLGFTVAAGLLTITPGLDTALVLRTAVAEGTRRALAAGVGICVGCLAWGSAVSLGLGTLLAAWPAAFDLLRLAGAGYLLWLGSTMLLRRRAALPQRSEQTAARSGNWLLRGFLTNALNPKVGVFYVTLLPQFIPSGAGWAFGVLLTGVHVTEGMLWFLLLAAATRRMAPLLQAPRVIRAADVVTGSVLVGFGVDLLGA